MLRPTRFPKRLFTIAGILLLVLGKAATADEPIDSSLPLGRGIADVQTRIEKNTKLAEGLNEEVQEHFIKFGEILYSVYGNPGDPAKKLIDLKEAYESVHSAVMNGVTGQVAPAIGQLGQALLDFGSDPTFKWLGPYAKNIKNINALQQILWEGAQLKQTLTELDNYETQVTKDTSILRDLQAKSAVIVARQLSITPQPLDGSPTAPVTLPLPDGPPAPVTMPPSDGPITSQVTPKPVDGPATPVVTLQPPDDPSALPATPKSADEPRTPLVTLQPPNGPTTLAVTPLAITPRPVDSPPEADPLATALNKITVETMGGDNPYLPDLLIPERPNENPGTNLSLPDRLDELASTTETVTLPAGLGANSSANMYVTTGDRTPGQIARADRAAELATARAIEQANRPQTFNGGGSKIDWWNVFTTGIQIAYVVDQGFQKPVSYPPPRVQTPRTTNPLVAPKSTVVFPSKSTSNPTVAGAPTIPKTAPAPSSGPTKPSLPSATPVASAPSGSNCSGGICCPTPLIPNPAAIACLSAPLFINGMPNTCDHVGEVAGSATTGHSFSSYVQFCVLPTK